MLKASLTCIWESIPEHILFVKVEIDLYNKMSEYPMLPAQAERRKEAVEEEDLQKAAPATGVVRAYAPGALYPALPPNQESCPQEAAMTHRG